MKSVLVVVSVFGYLFDACVVHSLHERVSVVEEISSRFRQRLYGFIVSVESLINFFCRTISLSSWSSFVLSSKVIPAGQYPPLYTLWHEV